MRITLEKLAEYVYHAEENAICHVDEVHGQIYVSFLNRPDITVALLIPSLQMDVAKGFIDSSDLSSLLFSIKRIANAESNG